MRDGEDWCHVNDVIYSESDDSLIWSCRELFVIKTDYSTGDIIWIMGDNNKYWRHNYSILFNKFLNNIGGTAPIGQHSLSLTDEGHLLLYNNGEHSWNMPAGIGAGSNLLISFAQVWRIDEEKQKGTSCLAILPGFKSYQCSSVYKQGQHHLITHSNITNRINFLWKL